MRSETVYAEVSSDSVDGITTVTSQFGVMAHNAPEVVLEKKELYLIQKCGFLIKSGTVDITVDDSVLNVEVGVYTAEIDNDDSTWCRRGSFRSNRNYAYIQYVFNEERGYPTVAYISVDQQVDLRITPAPDGYVYDTEDAVLRNIY
jgi:hypothetical protein